MLDRSEDRVGENRIKALSFETRILYTWSRVSRRLTCIIVFTGTFVIASQFLLSAAHSLPLESFTI